MPINHPLPSFPGDVVGLSRSEGSAAGRRAGCQHRGAGGMQQSVGAAWGHAPTPKPLGCRQGWGSRPGSGAAGSPGAGHMPAGCFFPVLRRAELNPRLFAAGSGEKTRAWGRNRGREPCSSTRKKVPGAEPRRGAAQDRAELRWQHPAPAGSGTGRRHQAPHRGCCPHPKSEPCVTPSPSHLAIPGSR